MKKIILSSLLAIAAAPAISQAADGTITFTGSVTTNTCVINGGAAGRNFAVALDPAPASALASAGQEAFAKPQAIVMNLTNCSPTTGNVRAFFEPGATVDSVTGDLRNMSTASGAATNVQIRLTDFGNNNGTINLNGGRGAQGVTNVAISSTGTATLTYGAKYRATGVATAGPVSSSVQYTLDFN